MTFAAVLNLLKLSMLISVKRLFTAGSLLEEESHPWRLLLRSRGGNCVPFDCYVPAQVGFRWLSSEHELIYGQVRPRLLETCQRVTAKLYQPAYNSTSCSHHQSFDRPS